MTHSQIPPSGPLPAADGDAAAPAPTAVLVSSDIDRLATLARIHLSNEERGPMLAQLNRVFGVLERLRAVDTGGIEPMTHPQAEALRERADEVTEPDRRAENQAVAPAVEDGLYLVPKVID